MTVQGSQLHEVEDSGLIKEIVWSGLDELSNRIFRVVFRAYGMGASMVAEYRDGLDGMGNDRWRTVDDKAEEARLIAMAIYARSLGLKSR